MFSCTELVHLQNIFRERFNKSQESLRQTCCSNYSSSYRNKNLWFVKIELQYCQFCFFYFQEKLTNQYYCTYRYVTISQFHLLTNNTDSYPLTESNIAGTLLTHVLVSGMCYVDSCNIAWKLYGRDSQDSSPHKTWWGKICRYCQLEAYTLQVPAHFS